jgi:hypothetical protein
MHAMIVDYYLERSLRKHGFAAVSDKLRDQLIEGGLDEVTASKNAPVMLEGMKMAREGYLNFKRIYQELNYREKGAPDFCPVS